MSEASRKAISDAFSTQTARFASFIDDLMKIHPQEKDFISNRSNQHAREVALLTRRRAQGIPRDLSQDLHLDAFDDACSTPVLSPMPIGDGGSLPCWSYMSSQTLHENSFDPDPLSPAALGLFSDTEQTRASHELSDFAMHPSDHLQVDRSRDRAVPELYQYEDVSGTMATNNVGTVVPAALYLEARDELGHPTAESPDQHPGTTHATRVGKKPNSTDAIHTRKSTLRSTRIAGRAHPSSEPQDTLYFQERSVMPSAGGRVEPTEAFARKRRKKDHGLDQDLKNLYHATGSPDSLCQLKDILATTRGSGNLTLMQRSSTIAETVHVLDRLDHFQQAAFLFRRIYLLKLWKLREGLLENAAKPKLGGSQPTLMIGKKQSNVIDNLVIEVFPGITPRPQEAFAVREWRKQYGVERKSLMNKFQAATKWHSLSERFSPGILALVPSGGEFQIQNQTFETLPATALEDLLNLLETKHGGCVRGAANLLTPFVNFILLGTPHPPPLRIESVTKEELINLDPSALVTLCREDLPSPQ